VSEAYIQALVHEHPACLPIAEIDAMFSGPVPICTELNTPAGPIDNFMVRPSGLPVLVECRLWRNPEARREVASQILDYARELNRWSSSDVQREVRDRLKRDGNPLLDMVRAVDPQLDEQQFNDALTQTYPPETLDWASGNDRNGANSVDDGLPGQRQQGADSSHLRSG
jgi:hypothetical protein